MILTITLNPSVDRRYNVSKFEIGKVFRSEETQSTPGGKGINVSKVLKLLGEEPLATGFLGGRAGEYIQENLNSLNIENKFVNIDGETRSCIAIISEDTQTEVLESGPRIADVELGLFLKRYKYLLKRCKYISISGSLPKGLARDTYKRLIEIAKEEGKYVLLDTSGKALETAIEAQPFLIKPNLDELQNLLGIKIDSEKDIIKAGKELLEKGIELVVVSLGEEGSLVFNKEDVYRVQVPEIEPVNPVGSGDSMIAGFAAGLSRAYNLEKTLKLAAACGTLNAMEKETGHLDPSKVAPMMEKIRVEKL